MMGVVERIDLERDQARMVIKGTALEVVIEEVVEIREVVGDMAIIVDTNKESKCSRCPR